MAIRLKTLFFILILSASVFSGTPLQSGDTMMKENVCPMKCCKKSAKSKKPKEKNEKYLCAILVCSQTNPGNTTSVSQVNLAPVLIASEKVTLFHILATTRPKGGESAPFAVKPMAENSQPKYIRHQRILI